MVYVCPMLYQHGGAKPAGTIGEEHRSRHHHRGCAPIRKGKRYSLLQRGARITYYRAKRTGGLAGAVVERGELLPSRHRQPEPRPRVHPRGHAPLDIQPLPDQSGADSPSGRQRRRLAGDRHRGALRGGRQRVRGGYMPRVRQRLSCGALRQSRPSRH